METTVLFRPVGENELRLIVESGYRRFPSRLPGQLIFYPVLRIRDSNRARLEREEFTIKGRIRHTLCS